MLISIESIKIKKRIRKDLGNLEPLKESIKRYGLLNPITVNEKNELIAGNRRLEAAKQLGWTTINAVIVNISDKTRLLELELEENTQRVNFSDTELMEGYAHLEKLRNPSIFRRLWYAIVEFFSKLFRKKY